jgi:curved DNA-binding protein CbpA
MSETHYTTLHLSPTAPFSEIRTRYLTLRPLYFRTDALKYRALQNAYIVLADPKKRAEYDASLNLQRLPSSSSSLTSSPNSSNSGSEHDAQLVYDGYGFLCESPTSYDGKPEERPRIKTQREVKSRIPVLKGYQRRVRHERLLCARPRWGG